MPETLYIEEAVARHPRVARILERFPRARRIPCERYTEVFNPKSQNFRLQKRHPALILAHKPNGFVLPAPDGYAVGGGRNFYFSHMLNCLYDCRYCFLQGMYRSAHYVLFVNFEDYREAIDAELAASDAEQTWFFSGYDCDSLAMESVTGFVADFLPFFAERPSAWLELRTKSSQVSALLNREPIPNCVVAFSFTPDETARALEHKAPSVDKRLAAMEKLQQRGWRLGLRFDPLIYQEGFEEQYRRLYDSLFRIVDAERLHSVSLGGFRLPKGFFRNMQRLYPDEALFAGPLRESGGMVGYRPDLEQTLREFCSTELLRYIPESIFYPCSY